MRLASRIDKFERQKRQVEFIVTETNTLPKGTPQCFWSCVVPMQRAISVKPLRRPMFGTRQ